MNGTLYCKNDTSNMYHLKNMFINELMLVIPLTMAMFIVGTKLGGHLQNKRKGVTKSSLNRK